MEGFRLIRNGHCKIWDIEPRKKFQIPVSKISVTHVRVYAGKISFFGSVNGEAGDIKTKRGIFFKVPFGAKFVEFSEFYKNLSGYHYGMPQWHAVKNC